MSKMLTTAEFRRWMRRTDEGPGKDAVRAKRKRAMSKLRQTKYISLCSRLKTLLKGRSSVQTHEVLHVLDDKKV